MGEPWKLCKPKPEEDIVQGIIPGHWDPETVHSFRGIYSIVNFDRFKANLANLCQKAATELDRGIRDDEAFLHDHAASLLNSSTSCKPRWDGSTAQRLLKEDMDETGCSPGNPSRICLLRSKGIQKACTSREALSLGESILVEKDGRQEQEEEEERG
jgi:hypothetical protein